MHAFKAMLARISQKSTKRNMKPTTPITNAKMNISLGLAASRLYS